MRPLASLPEQADDFDGFFEHALPHRCRRPSGPDNVLVQVLARAGAQAEPAGHRAAQVARGLSIEQVLGARWVTPGPVVNHVGHILAGQSGTAIPGAGRHVDGHTEHTSQLESAREFLSACVRSARRILAARFNMMWRMCLHPYFS